MISLPALLLAAFLYFAGMANPRIVFMGTPAFAVASLDAMLQAGCQVVAVVTAPDKPAGRGMRLIGSAVKEYAAKHGLKVLQPERLKSVDFIETLRSLRADLQVVVAFRMLPEVVWSMPPMGTVNLHGSLLPRYRGAAPIQHAVMSGETETGVTTFLLQHEIDTGDILLQQRIPIGEQETAGELHDRMMVIGATLLVKTIQGLAENALQSVSQAMISAENFRKAPKILQENCRINWQQSVQIVHNLIRGLSPAPGAFTVWEGKTLKIFRSRIEPSSMSVAAGTHRSDGKSLFYFACADGWLQVLELQLEGRKRMKVADFLRGYRG